MTPDELKEALQSRSWRIEADGHQYKRTGVDWWAWKILEGAADCTGNDKPPNVCIYPWSISTDSGHYINNVQFELAGGLSDVWIQLMVYSVPLEQAIEKLPRATAILLAAWNAAAAMETT